MTEDPNDPSNPGDNNWDPVPPAGEGLQTPPTNDAPSWASNPVSPAGEGSQPPPAGGTPSWASAPPPPAEGADAQAGLITCLVLGIVETICCCPATPFGIAAIVFAAIGLSKNGKRDYVAARKNRKIAIWLLGIGFALFLAFFIYWQVSGAESWFTYLEDVSRDLEEKSTSTIP